MNKSFATGVILLFNAIVLSGCATVHLDPGPSIRGLSRDDGNQAIVMLPIKDERMQKSNIGYVSLLTFRLTEDPTLPLRNHVIYHLYTKGIRTIYVDSPLDQSDRIPELLKENNAKRALMIRLVDLSIRSLDTLLDPPLVKVATEVSIFNEKGEIIFDKDFKTKIREMIWIDYFSAKTIKLINNTLREAGERIAKDWGVISNLRADFVN